MPFSQNLKRIRTLRGLSQAELAERCGFASQSRIGNYEANDERFPSQEDLMKLCEVLQCSPSELLDGQVDANSIQDAAIIFLAIADTLRDAMPGVAAQLAAKIEGLAGPAGSPDRLTARIAERLRAAARPQL